MHKIVWFLMGILCGLVLGTLVNKAYAADPVIGRIQEGECGVALAELNVELTTNEAKSQMVIWIKDHLRQPVSGARVYVYWNTREEGAENYCTTNEQGNCTLKNTASFEFPLEEKPYPIYVRIKRVEHPNMTYKEYDDSKQFWVLCPEELNCD